MKIFLSVGHSILKSGVCTSASGYVNEYQYCKEIGAILRDYLVAQGNEVVFVVCPERSFTNKSKEQSYKLGIERSNKFDLVLELHLNSSENPSAHGCEVFYYAGDSKGRSYATRINAKLAEVFKGRGAKTSASIGGLYMVDSTRATAVLIESFFCSNKNDCDSGADKNLVARKIAEGVAGINIPSTGTSAGGGNVTAPPNKKSLGKVNAIYCVQTGGKKWWPAVTNMNNVNCDGFAGAGDGVPITGIAIKVDKGTMRYRVHIKDVGWLPYVTGYNVNDFKNGYAGDGRAIDAVEVYFTTPDGYEYQQARYRVSPVNTDKYYAFQIDDFKTDGMDGYAGEIGILFDKFQLYIG